MLKLEIPKRKYWDDNNSEFRWADGVSLKLEHSLIAVSKWEAIHRVSFLSEANNLKEEDIVDYIKCMTINQCVPDDVYDNLTREELVKIVSYINDKPTATTISEPKNKRSGFNSNTRITSEQLYGWMVLYGIPWEAEKWNIERLIMLIRICIENDKERNGKGKKKGSQAETLNEYSALNAARRAKYGNL